MKITHDQHQRYVAIDFSDNFETAANPLTQSQWGRIHDIITEAIGGESPPTDESVWHALVKLFCDLPDGKATKSFVYQMLILNGITNITSGVKTICYNYEKNKGERCHIIQKYVKYIESHGDRIGGICRNLGLCVKWASAYPCAKMLDTLPDVIEIDDSILTQRRQTK